ncbi:MAG: glutamate-5-semialdehyde dehydrogenase [Actinomycetota bacterium]|jgi:glutamate-5-semialdehyde dehydrogenase|nr:glutamate-5-semialdehyde dehydrogenase [Actinomycetota bacterium]
MSNAARGEARILQPTLLEQAKKVKDASRNLALASTAQKNEALELCASLLRDRSGAILSANELDIRNAREVGTSATVIDRLMLNQSRIDSMAQGLRDVAALADPVGEIAQGWVRPNGLQIRKVRVPLGVIGIIYENRPNVTSDAAGLCLKSGNAAFLRGSSGAINSNIEISDVLSEGLKKAGLPAAAVTLVRDTSRESATEFMKLRGYIDCLIPRGGPSLVSAIVENATVPYVIDGDGNCHIYVDATADLDQAVEIIANAKVQRPSVCNAVETVLVHENVAAELLPRLEQRMPTVELRADPESRKFLTRSVLATEVDYATEFLDLILALKRVSGLDEAIAHIRKYGSGHSEAILTNDYSASKRFVAEVDAAAVLVNASTRFVDGGEVGFGAEIGISTQKLHARGPMGLRELTTEKFVIEGNGQVRV